MRSILVNNLNLVLVRIPLAYMALHGDFCGGNIKKNATFARFYRVSPKRDVSFLDASEKAKSTYEDTSFLEEGSTPF